jgi:C1A family cysteine protease
MGRIAIAVFSFTVLCVAFSSLAVDRVPTREELDRIEETRRMIKEKGYDWEAGVTSVSHLSPEEFQKLLGVRVPPDYEERKRRARREGRLIEAVMGMSFPTSFDWRAQGGVTPVKNQGSCGSCWAFCAAAAFESQILIHSGLEENLSEQAVLSCNTEDDGCGGGWMSTAYDLWMDYGAVRESCMAYHEVDTDPCTQTSCEVAAALDGYYYVGDDVNDIKQALLGGPVAVAMAACGGFGSYTSGCYEDTCSEINHGVTIVGWDDDMCSGEGAWIVKNSWGPDFGDNGYINMKYGTCLIGYAAEALNYTPAQTVHFFHDSHIIDDTAGDGDGNVETGEVIGFPITLLNIGADTATTVSATLQALTAGVTVTDSVATYPDIPKGKTGQSDSPHFSFVVTPTGPSCGAVRFRLTVSSDQGTSHVNLAIQAGEVLPVFDDDFETDQGWTVGDTGDGATTGLWDRGDPDATWWGNQPVQPGDDHTSPGTYCYVTGASGGSSQGTNDVDGGKTTLLSPTIDLSDTDSAVLTYYRWFASETGSNPNDDDFVVDVSNNDGTSWQNLETLDHAVREWTRMEFYLEDYLSLSNQMKFRLIAQDNGSGGSIVEAAVDDFVIMTCQGGVADTEPPDVTVIAANGGETVEHGTNYDIQWNASDNTGVVSVAILLSTDSGLSFPDTIVTGEVNDGSYSWSVPDMDSRTARIRVLACDAAMNEASDISDADFSLLGTLSRVIPPNVDDIPEEVVLNVSSGNPALSISRIVFGVPAPTNVSLAVYDVTGRLVRSLISDHREEGYHVIDWSGGGHSGSRVSPGIYFLRLDCNEGRRTAKVVIAK